MTANSPTIDPSNDHGIDPDDPARYDGAEASLEDLLGMASKMLGVDPDEGWGGIESPAAALAKQRAESQQAIKREADAFRDCFLTPAGRKVLEVFRQEVLLAEPYPEEAHLPMEAITPLMIAHDARTRFVRAIFSAIALAENRPQTSQEQDI